MWVLGSRGGGKIAWKNAIRRRGAYAVSTVLALSGELPLRCLIGSIPRRVLLAAHGVRNGKRHLTLPWWAGQVGLDV